MTAPRMRAGTTDRQAAVDLLSRHFTEGRLTAGEFDERVAKAYASTYLDELPELSVDLPAEEPRRGPGSRRPGPDGFGQFGPPGPWSGPGRPGPVRTRNARTGDAAAAAVPGGVRRAGGDLLDQCDVARLLPVPADLGGGGAAVAVPRRPPPPLGRARSRDRR